MWVSVWGEGGCGGGGEGVVNALGRVGMDGGHATAARMYGGLYP